MNYLKFLPKDWQSASLIIVLVQLGMFAFLWQGQSHIKELLTNHVTGTEKKIEKLDGKIEKLDNKIEKLDSKIDSKIEKLDGKIEKIYEILLSNKGNQK